MKKIILLTSLILYTVLSNAQSYNYFDKNKLTFGGGFGLQFGDYTVINIAPQVGYNFSKYFNGGVGVFYSYYTDKYYDTDNYRISDQRSYLGLNIYGKLYPVNFLVLMIQPEVARMWNTIKIDETSEQHKDSKVVPSIILGGGLRLGPVTAMIKYDVAQNSYSPYGKDIFYSIGYSWNF